MLARIVLTDLDTELMPWSLKAVELLRTRYAAVWASAGAALHKVVRSLAQAVAVHQNAHHEVLLCRLLVDAGVNDERAVVVGRVLWCVAADLRRTVEPKLAPERIVGARAQPTAFVDVQVFVAERRKKRLSVRKFTSSVRRPPGMIRRDPA